MLRLTSCPCHPPARTVRSLVLVTVLALAMAACAEPPDKEMNQAQGAIDAARAAGAEEYAAADFTRAVDALAQSEAAVTARDYRLALAHALDSREHAQNAAKAAVDGRARARGDAERVLAEAATLVERLAGRLEDAEVVRLPARTRTSARTTLDEATLSLQEARSSLADERYLAVMTTVDGVAPRVQAALEAIDAAVAGAARGRKR